MLNRSAIIFTVFITLTLSAQEVIKFKGTILNRPLVEVTVNGEGPYEFPLDIGASGIGRINKPLHDELDFPIAGTEMNSDGINTREEKTVKVNELKFGSIVIEDTELIMRDYGAPISGILGRGFFADKTLSIDFPNEQVILSDEPLDPNSENALPYERPFWVKGKIGEADAEFSLDTGSSGGFVFPKSFLTKNNIEYEETGVVKEGRRTNTKVKLVEAKLLDDVTIGGITFSQPVVLVNDQLNEINVGAKVLKDYSITIDQRKNVIMLSQ